MEAALEVVLILIRLESSILLQDDAIPEEPLNTGISHQGDTGTGGLIGSGTNSTFKTRSAHIRS